MEKDHLLIKKLVTLLYVTVVKLKILGKKPSSLFNYYKRMT